MMNRHIQQLVQEVSHALLRERVEDTSSSPITEAEKEHIKTQVVKLFENQDIPLDSDRLHEITNELVATKNAQLQSMKDKSHALIGTSFVHKKLSGSELKNLGEHERTATICDFILNHNPLSPHEYELVSSKIFTHKFILKHFLVYAIPLSMISLALVGLSMFLASKEFLVLSLLVPLTELYFWKITKKHLYESVMNLLKNKKSEQTIKLNSNEIALKFLGLPAFTFSNKAYALYAKHMCGKKDADVNFLATVDLANEKTIEFIEKTGIEKNSKSNITFQRWKDQPHGIKHIEMMALGLVATHLNS